MLHVYDLNIYKVLICCTIITFIIFMVESTSSVEKAAIKSEVSKFCSLVVPPPH